MEAVDQYYETVQVLSQLPEATNIIVEMQEKLCDLAREIDAQIVQTYGFSAYMVSPDFHAMIGSTYRNETEQQLRLEKDAQVTSAVHTISEMIHIGIHSVLTDLGLSDSSFGMHSYKVNNETMKVE